MYLSADVTILYVLVMNPRAGPAPAKVDSTGLRIQNNFEIGIHTDIYELFNHMHADIEPSTPSRENLLFGEM